MANLRSVPRRHLGWHLLTLLVFAATLALLLMPGTARAAGNASAIEGRWRVALDHPGGVLPFGLEVRAGKRGPEAFILNPPERLRVEQVSVSGDTIALAFPSYNSRLELRRGADDRLTGSATLWRTKGAVTLKASGERGDWRFVKAPARAAADLTGRWTVEYGAERTKGIAILKQTGNRVSGTVQLPSGDTRYLAGEISGGRVQLSQFDGGFTALWTADLKAGALDGQRFSATATTGTPWRATRARGATVEAVAVEKPAADRLDFTLPTADGTPLKLSDPRYRGKVVVISIGGAWCPNCHDEAIFLGPYAASHKAQGLEVIGLQFEYGADQTRALRQLTSFQRRYRLPYPLVLGGEPNPEDTKKVLGALGPVKVYPSTIFIGRDGRVREVHVGWAGPATGALNAQAKKHFDETVTRLLREKA